VGDATAQWLGEFLVSVLPVAGDRAEVALQPGPEMLESRQPQGLIDRTYHADLLSLQVFEETSQ
jgi:hypothetical protein